MIDVLKNWSAPALALSALLTACGGQDGAPALTATTTESVQNRKAQPAHDSRITQLDDDALTKLIAGRTIGGFSPNGRQWRARFDASGAVSIRWEGPSGPGGDSGTWLIEGGAACVTWRVLDEGQENCMTVHQVDDGQYNLFNDNGSMNSLIMAIDS
jgi:hypothetical protein